MILKWILGKQGWSMWTGFIWHRTGAGDRLLWIQQQTFSVYKRRDISLLPRWLLSSQGQLCSM
jgi:hypothetical protein